MMQDLTPEVFPDGPFSALTPTSQAGTNQRVSNQRARTAPGSEPALPANSFPNEITEHPAPTLAVQDHRPPNVVSADGAKATADANTARPSLFTRADGTAWADSDASDFLPETRGRPSIRQGEWNSVLWRGREYV